MNLTSQSSSEFAKAKLMEHSAFTVEGPGLGPINKATLMRDPKHLLFTLSRYKFVSKMLKGKPFVCEIGCHEATGSLIVAKEVGHLTAIDLQIDVINFCKKEYSPFQLNIAFYAADALEGLPPSPNSHDSKYDAIYLLDVLEHIDPNQEDILLGSITNSLRDDGVLLVGLPSLESQEYASPVSKAQHINCKSLIQLHEYLSKYFKNVFMFGMNDEVLHTGYAQMCQYLFALCISHQ